MTIDEIIEDHADLERTRDHPPGDDEDRVVATKDRDFGDSPLPRSVPRRLLVVATGNNEVTLRAGMIGALPASVAAVRSSARDQHLGALRRSLSAAP